MKPYRAGGPTSAANGQGLCERCNQTKESRHWHSNTEGDGTVTTRTPTGHRHRSRPPPLLGQIVDVDLSARPDIIWATAA